MKDFIISANLGYDDSLKVLKTYYDAPARGMVSKEDFCSGCIEKSPQRCSKSGSMGEVDVDKVGLHITTLGIVSLSLEI